MSQRRLEARRAKQAQRQEARHKARAAQRPLRAPVRTQHGQQAVPAARRGFWTRRNRWIAAGSVAVALILVIAVYTYRSMTAPLPGETFAAQGLSHLADENQPHPPYNSNPPTTGWHTAPMVKPGIYTRPRVPETIGHHYEHGGVWILYNCPDGCDEDVKMLEGIVNKAIDRGRPVALAPYPPLDAKFSVSAWRHLLKFESLDQEATKAIENFVARHACRFNPEGGPYCAGVRGKGEADRSTDEAQEAQQSGTTMPVTATPFSVFGTQTPAPSGTPAPTPTPSR